MDKPKSVIVKIEISDTHLWDDWEVNSREEVLSSLAKDIKETVKYNLSIDIESVKCEIKD